MNTTTNAQRGSLLVTRLSAETAKQQALADLMTGVRRYEAWLQFAYNDIRLRFRRSMLGPFWLTLSMAIMIGTMGFVFSKLFQQHIEKTLPYIATGIIFWNLLTTCINEGANAFIEGGALIRNVPAPLSVHVYRVLARNIMIFGFNIVIYFGILLFFAINPGIHVLLVVPGVVLFIINAAWMSLAVGILSTRYRDIPQIIANILQVLFFLTPIFWSPESLPQRPVFITMNPLYHLLEVVRAPLLGQAIAVHTWYACVVMAILGVVFTGLLYRRAYPRMSYWV